MFPKKNTEVKQKLYALNEYCHLFDALCKEINIKINQYKINCCALISHINNVNVKIDRGSRYSIILKG